MLVHTDRNCECDDPEPLEADKTFSTAEKASKAIIKEMMYNEKFMHDEDITSWNDMLNKFCSNWSQFAQAFGWNDDNQDHSFTCQEDEDENITGIICRYHHDMAYEACKCGNVIYDKWTVVEAIVPDDDSDDNNDDDWVDDFSGYDDDSDDGSDDGDGDTDTGDDDEVAEDDILLPLAFRLLMAQAANDDDYDDDNDDDVQRVALPLLLMLDMLIERNDGNDDDGDDSDDDSDDDSANRAYYI
jgi:hypothetical protein